MRHAASAAAAAAAALGLLLLAACAAPAQAALVLPITFQPIQGANDSVLFPLYANVSLFGVFIAGLDIGTPPQKLNLLIDTGSGIVHVAGKGCGSSCGLGLSEASGYDLNASSTGAVVPCGEMCSCPRCTCSTQADGGPTCSYMLSYADGSSSSGGLVSDRVGFGDTQFDMKFGVQERQTGVLQSMGIDGLLGLDRSHGSFVGQLRDQNLTNALAFGTCWEVEYRSGSQSWEQGFPGQNASSYLMLGLPESILEDLQPGFTPLMEGPPSEWEVELEAVEVLGPGGGNITEELRSQAPAFPSFAPPRVGPPMANGSAPAGANSSEAAAVEEPTGGLAILDSGATYTHLPRPAWEAFQKLVTSAVAARGPKLKQVVNRPSATCWEGLPADALTKDAIALAASFPDVQLRFKGGANFTTTPEGYLVTPTAGGQSLICLSIFPWDTPLSLLGARIRRRVLTIHDDSGARIGFANVDDCGELAADWEAA